MVPGPTLPFWLERPAQQLDLDDEATPEPQRKMATTRQALRPWELTHAPGSIMAGVAADMKRAITTLAEASGGDGPAFVDALDVMMREMVASAARRREQEATNALEREAAETRRRGTAALGPRDTPPRSYVATATGRSRSRSAGRSACRRYPANAAARTRSPRRCQTCA